MCKVANLRGRLMLSITRQVHYRLLSSDSVLAQAEEVILVTTYNRPEVLAHTPQGATGGGILRFTLNGKTGKLTQRGTLDVRPNPAFVIRHPTIENLLYATTERIDGNGEVLTLSLDDPSPAGSGVRALARTDAGGRSTCYLLISDDARSLTAVNYWDARVCVLPLGPDGAVGAVAHTETRPGAEYVDSARPDRAEHWAYRQRWPHTHCAVAAPAALAGADGARRYFYVCDLGLDAVVQYRLDPGGALARRGEVALAPGGGPRHLVFHPRARAAYVVNELTSTVSVLAFDGHRDLAGAAERADAPGALLRHVQTVSTLPADWQGRQTQRGGVWKAASHCSEVPPRPAPPRPAPRALPTALLPAHSPSPFPPPSHTHTHTHHPRPTQHAQPQPPSPFSLPCYPPPHNGVLCI